MIQKLMSIRHQRRLVPGRGWEGVVIRSSNKTSSRHATSSGENAWKTAFSNVGCWRFVVGQQPSRTTNRNYFTGFVGRVSRRN